MEALDAIRGIVNAVKLGVEKQADNYQSPSRSELEDLAKELHSVGDIKHKKDDYDKRLDALASDFLPKLSDEDRGRFMGAVFDGDKGATGSWLQGDRLDKLVADGRISADDRRTVLSSLASGYNNGQVDKDVTWDFLKMGGVDGEIVDKNPAGSRAGADYQNENNSGEVFDRLLAGLDDGKGGVNQEFSKFVEKFSIDQINDGAPGNDKDANSRGDYLGLLINAADRAGPDQSVINNILHGVDKEKREQVIDDISKGFSKVTTENAWLNRDDSKLSDAYNRDPMNLIIKAVANDKESRYSDDKRSYAGDLAEYVYTQSANNPYGDNGFYTDKNMPKEGRQEALNELMLKKGAEIFDTKRLGESGIGEDGETNSTRNVRIMANLERLTGLSPTNEQGTEVLNKLAGNADMWSKDYINALKSDNENEKLQATQKLTHLMASTEQAVLDGFSDKAEDDAARKADLESMMNLFVGLLPGGDSLGTGLRSSFKSVFGEDSGAVRALDKVLETGAGEAADGAATDLLKGKVVDALSKSGNEDKYLKAFTENANVFIEDQLLRELSGDQYAGIRQEISKEASQLLVTS